MTASVVYKSYPESRKALQKLEGKIFKGDSCIHTYVYQCLWFDCLVEDGCNGRNGTYVNAMTVCCCVQVYNVHTYIHACMTFQ